MTPALPDRFRVYAYDWERHREVAPRVREASHPAQLTGAELAAVQRFLLDAPVDSTSEYRAAGCLLALCVVGEPVVLGPGVPALLRRLRRESNGEDLADDLAELLLGRSHVEPWFQDESAPIGLCTVAQTRRFAASVERFRQAVHRPPPRDVLRSLARMFVPANPAGAGLEDLLALVRRAADEGLGLVAVAETA